MIELIKTDKGLTLVPVDLEALANAIDIHDALESNLCNGWRRILPTAAQAQRMALLTDCYLLTDDWEDDDQGTLTKLGRVYWDADYQVTDTLELLRKGETVTWVAAA